MNVGATAIESILDITVIESRSNTLLCLTVGGIDLSPLRTFCNDPNPF